MHCLSRFRLCVTYKSPKFIACEGQGVHVQVIADSVCVEGLLCASQMVPYGSNIM